MTDIKKYKFKAGLSLEFEIVNLGELYQKSAHLLTKPHRTNFYHILWFQKGTPIHLVDFTPIEIAPETILFLNQDVVHRFDAKENFDGIAILFTEAFFCRTEADTKFLRNSILFNDLFAVSNLQIQKQAELFADLLRLMANELENPADNFQIDILKNLLHNFLLLAERKKRTENFVEVKRGVDLSYVMNFRDLLEQNYQTQRKVNYYARQIFITEKRLNQATTKILGKTPKELIDDRVLLEAKRLLAHTAESVKEIGYTLGFEEPTNFIKYFRKHNHLTPLEFRGKFIST